MLRSPIVLSAAALALCAALPAHADDMSRKDVVEMFKKAADWSVKAQNDNGSWGAMPGSDVKGELGMTAIMTAGLAEHPKELGGAYAEAIGKAVKWILACQQEDGSFSQGRGGLTTYRTALSVIALQAHDAKAHAEAIKKGATWLKETQFQEASDVSPDSVHYGGWGYDSSGSKPDADMSNTGMALQALEAAGISKDDPVYQRALKFISRCQNNSETNDGASAIKPKDDGGFYYDPGVSRNKSSAVENPDGTLTYESYAGITYTGLMSLLYAGAKKDDPRVKAAMDWIKKNWTLEKNTGLGVRNPDPKADQQGMFYYYMVFAKCLDAYGEASIETADGAKVWTQELAHKLKERQAEDGSWTNEKNGRWWEGNPLIPTSYMLNALNRVLKHMPAGE